MSIELVWSQPTVKEVGSMNVYHAPEPWRYVTEAEVRSATALVRSVEGHEDYEPSDWVEVRDAHNVCIGSAHCGSFAENTKVARLMAAAPDLLRALRFALVWIEAAEPDGTLLETIKAAIAKAEGA